MTERQRMLAKRAQMNRRLKNFYIRKSEGMPFLHWTRCGWKDAFPRLTGQCKRGHPYAPYRNVRGRCDECRRLREEISSVKSSAGLLTSKSKHRAKHQLVFGGT